MKMAHHLIVAITLILLPLVVGCSSDPIAGQTKLEKATEVLRQADYISFDYSANGCHDRSILLAAELAAAGIPSNAQFIVATGEPLTSLTPRQFPELEWSYHVAPVIYLDESEPPTDERKFLRIVEGEVIGDIDSDAYILDPALYPDQIAMPLATWVADLTGQRQMAFLSAADARQALDVPQDESTAIERIATTVIPNSLEEMPKFWQFQISASCSFLSRDAEKLEKLTDQEIAAIRRAMNAGAANLLERMLAQNLLLKVEPIAEFLCWDF